MNRVEDLINSAKTNELLGELLHIKKEEEKKSNVLMWVAITLGAVLAVAGIAYAVYRFFTPDYLEDFDEDFDDDYDDYDDDDDFFDDRRRGRRERHGRIIIQCDAQVGPSFPLARPVACSSWVEGAYFVPEYEEGKEKQT